MIKEGLMFRFALIISTVVHFGGFGLTWWTNCDYTRNGIGTNNNKIIVFEIGWIENKNLIHKDKEILKPSQDAGLTNGVITKTIPSIPSHKGRSGYAKENIGADRNQYLLEVRKCIERAKFYPREAKRKLISGAVSVDFYIDENGFANNIRIIKPSGFSILDSTANEIILRASPFPKPNNGNCKYYIQTTILFKL